ncbi:MAG: GNAT family N-acetyltransferase [bacterium]|nr:GNAT family N-acetyltransferase [bacterium]
MKNAQKQAKQLNADRINIKKIKLKNLAEFARRAIDDPAFGDVSPISLLRAESQSKNPQGEPDDIALLLALRENRCVGYHGLLPGWLRYEDRISKIYWLVTFYLNAASRGKGYGKQLVAEIQNTNVDLVTTGITDAAAGVYRSAGFRRLEELLYFRLQPENRDLLMAVLQNLRPVEKTFTSKPTTRLIQEEIQTSSRQATGIRFPRDTKSINWMIRNPWIVSRQDARQDVKNYYFSRVRDLFQFIALEIFTPDGAIRKGYLTLSISRHKNRTTLKVLDYYFHDPRDVFIAGYYAIKYAGKYRADRLEFPSGLDIFLEEQVRSTHRIKRKKRLYLFHPRDGESPLARLADKITLNYCDSDTAFT